MLFRRPVSGGKSHSVLYSHHDAIGLILRGVLTLTGAAAVLLPGAWAQTQLGSVAVGTTANGTATVTVSQAGTLASIKVRTQGIGGLDFASASGGSCATGTAYSVGQTCTVDLTFTPRYAGTRYGAAVLDDASGNVLGTAYLQGSGLGAQIGYLPFSQKTPSSFCGSATVAGVAVDGGGNLYVTCPANGTVYKVVFGANGQYTTTQIGTNVVANDGLQSPQGIAVDGAGNVYIDDSTQNRVVMQRPTGSGFTQVDLNIAGLDEPMALAVDGAGNLYLDDVLHSRVIEAIPTGSGNYSVKQLLTNIQSPTGIAVDGGGDVFFTAPSGPGQIFMLANSSGTYTEGLLGSGFKGAGAVGVDGVGNVYVLDANAVMWVERPASPGTYTQEQLDSGQASSGQPGFPIAVGGAGNLWAIPALNGSPSLLEYTQGTPPPMSFGQATLGVVGSQNAFGVMDIGNQALDLTQVSFPADFPQIPGVTDSAYPPGLAPVGDCQSGLTVSIGAYCMVGAEFFPMAPLNGQAILNVTEPLSLAGNIAGSPVQYQMSGTELEPNPPTMLLTTSADPSVAGQSPVFTVTATGTQVVPTGNVTIINVTTFPEVDVATTALDTSGKATFDMTGLTPGTYTYFASYSGDGNYQSSFSGTIQQSVVPASGGSGFGDVAIGEVSVGGSSAVIPLTITFTQAETLGGVAIVTDGAPNQDFQDGGGSTCKAGQSYSANATCTVNVVFKPQLAGMRRGAVVLTDASGNGIGTGYLGGIGKGPQVAFGSQNLSTISGAAAGAVGLATDAAGNVYSVNNDSNVYKLTRGSGGYTETKLITSTQAAAIAVDGAGDLFLLAGAPASVDHVLMETPTATGFTSTAVGTAFDPQSISVGGEGSLYIADHPDPSSFSTIGRILKEKPTNGGYVESEVGSAWNAPSQVAVDGESNVYVVDNPAGCGASACLYKAVPNGSSYTITQIATPEYVVYGMSADATGSVYILENDSSATLTTYLVKETPQSDGSYTATSVILGTNVYPNAFAMDPLGNVFTVVNEASGGSLAELDMADAPSLTFASTAKGVTSGDSPQVVTVNNIGNAALDLTAVSFPPDFPELAGASGDCGAQTALAAGTGCTLSIDFTPATMPSSSSGQLSEAVSITANPLNTAGTRLSVAVSGIEVGISISATVATVVPGATTGNTSSVTVAPFGGFTGNVLLTAAVTSQPAGAQSLPTVTVTSPVSITGTGAATATVTIGTIAPTSARNQEIQGKPGWAAGGAVFAVLACFGLRRRGRRWLLGLAAIAFVGLVTSCGGGGGNSSNSVGTTPGSYTVTVTATGGNSSANCTFTLTVQ